jgi:hypothetical protein
MAKNTIKSHFFKWKKEFEFRFNDSKQNIYRVLLGIIRKEPLKLETMLAYPLLKKTKQCFIGWFYRLKDNEKTICAYWNAQDWHNFNTK